MLILFRSRDQQEERTFANTTGVVLEVTIDAMLASEITHQLTDARGEAGGPSPGEAPFADCHTTGNLGLIHSVALHGLLEGVGGGGDVGGFHGIRTCNAPSQDPPPAVST